MRTRLSSRFGLIWQVVFLLTSMTWLLAPALNHNLSYRVTLISQYETAGQPYAWLFRVGDVLAGLLLLLVAWLMRQRDDRLAIVLLLTIGVGLTLDPILTTSCVVHRDVCTERVDISSILHGVETVMTAGAFLWLTGLDFWRRRNLVSLVLLLFQAAYGVLFVSQFAKVYHFNTFPQYLYQCGVLLWLAWYCRDRYFDDGAAPDSTAAKPSDRQLSVVRWAVAAWAMANGLFAIVSSLSDFSLWSRAGNLYADFAGHTAWLEQHGVVVGVIMLYLSRHILRGEQRARQIFLVLTGLEVLRYGLVTPDPILLGLYVLTFAGLFVTAEDFQRGAVPLTWSMRFKDLLYLMASLLLAASLALLFLGRNEQVARIARRSLDHFSDYVFTVSPPHARHIESILLAHTLSAFLLVSAAALLWVLFKPSRVTHSARDPQAIYGALQRYSNSSEDFFKLWPADKDYFWDSQYRGLVVYKVVGPVAFALPDPVAAVEQRGAVLDEFVTWARSKRLRTCFLAVSETSRELYASLTSQQIGASALIDVRKFNDETVRDKWWRWKLNRARKQGYDYAVSQPPHSPELMAALRAVSDDWLKHGEHQERGFALGYFDEGYLQQSPIHYLTLDNRVVAFVNQLPELRRLPTTTIDLLRYTEDAHDAMPYLLAQVIEQAQKAGYQTFDLGFVPFAASRGQLLKIAASLSAGRFSAKGLEQFKNKFDPNWQPNYVAFDGDLADLALIALNLEKVMQP